MSLRELGFNIWDSKKVTPKNIGTIKIGEEEKSKYENYFWERDELQEKYPLKKFWYKDVHSVSPEALACYLLGCNTELLNDRHLEDYFDFFQIFKEIRDLILKGIDEGNLKTYKTHSDYSLDCGGYLCYELKLSDIIKWMEQEHYIDPDFPLSFPDKVVKYVTQREKGYRKIKQTEEENERLREENSKLKIENKELKILSIQTPEEYLAIWGKEVKELANKYGLEIEDSTQAIKLFSITTKHSFWQNEQCIGDRKLPKKENLGLKKVRKLMHDYAHFSPPKNNGNRSQAQLDKDKNLEEKLKKDLLSPEFDAFREKLIILCDKCC